MDYLREKRFKRIIVAADDGTLLGMVNQRDLIDISYAKWANMLRERADELGELVRLLERKTDNFRRIAETDQLTHCFNRNKMDEALANEINRFNRYNSARFSAAFLDIDHFKTINDVHGHLCGDHVLKQLVGVVQESIRDVDLFARWGGDEFILLMPSSSLDNAVHQVERIRQIVYAQHFEDVGAVSVSIGVAEYQKNESQESFINRMDQALYEAKYKGRNRVEVSQLGEVKSA